jgi:4,5-DOPA dioxygenase extradiol
MTSAARMPAVFLGHGSPMNALDDNAFTRAWRALGSALPRPRAILCVSAHWVTDGPVVTAMAAPRTIHDFGRFPQALFDVRYPAPGDPALAARVATLLAPARVGLDRREWGLDHGAWSVLVHLFPDADIPVVQLGMDGTLDALGHLALARRLAPLRDEGVLILGSGNVVHNLPAMTWHDQGGPAFDWAARFDAAIVAAILEDAPDKVAGYAALGEDAARSVPTPEHFWPLLYVLGVRETGDEADIGTDVIEYGSLSMLSVALRPPTLAA